MVTPAGSSTSSTVYFPKENVNTNITHTKNEDGTTTRRAKDDTLLGDSVSITRDKDGKIIDQKNENNITKAINIILKILNFISPEE